MCGSFDLPRGLLRGLWLWLWFGLWFDVGLARHLLDIWCNVNDFGPWKALEFKKIVAYAHRNWYC